MSTLTVPTAGNSAGRAAQVQVEDPGFGQVIAQAGDVALQIGTRIENERLSRERQRFQVDIARDFNQLRQEVDQIGDPDELDRVWQNRTAELRQSYFEGQTEDGRPLVDPKNRDQIGLAFDELNNRHSYAVGVRAIQARQSQSEANWVRYSHEAGNTIANAPDPQTRATVIAQGDDMLADLVDRGVITAEEAAKRGLDMRSNVANATAIRQVSDDPEGFLAASNAGAFNDLGAEAVARYQVQAQATIDRNAAAAAKAEEKSAADAAQAIGDRLADHRKIFEADRVPTDEAFLARPDVQAHPDFPKTQAALDLARDRADLPRMRPQDLEALIKIERNQKVDYPYQTEKLELLEAQLEETRKGLREDPVAYAQTAGFDVPELPDFNPDDPSAFMRGLRLRQVHANTFLDHGYTDTPRMLSAAERDQVKALASAANDPADRVKFAQAALPVLQGDGPDSASQLIDDPVFLHIGQQVASGQISTATAEATFRGQQVIAEQNVVMPPVADRTGASFETLRAMFADLPGGERMQSSAVAAADALYASRIRTDDPTADIDEDLYRQSLHDVMGGSGVFDSRHALGGVQEVYDLPTILPPGVNGRQVERAVGLLGTVANSELPEQTRQTRQRPNGRSVLDGILVDRLRALSASGLPPAGSDRPEFADELAQMQIRAVGPDTYAFVFDAQDETLSLSDTDGKEYRFSLTRLMQMVQP